MNFGITRIGVHAGPALVGNFGGSEFFDYTAHGDTINTASRLEAANKQLGTRICVSETIAKAAANFKGRPVGDIVLRGRSEPLRAYEPLREEAFAAPATAQYSGKPSPSSKPAMQPRCRPSPPWWARMPTIRSPASISSDCSTAPRASACSWNSQGIPEHDE